MEVCQKFIPSKRARCLTDQRFGRLVVLEPVGRSMHGAVLWKCKCDCGQECVVRSDHLLDGTTRSCRCLSKEAVAIRSRTHGMSRTPNYRTWESMLARCENQKKPRFKDYGGRGIKVCKQWHRFEIFFKDMGLKPEGRSIDRIDNDGNYEPGNCRWATPYEQRMNQRDRKDQKWFLGFNLKSGEFEENNSQAEFKKEHTLPHGSVSNCLHGRQKSTKGWEFNYLT